MPFAALLEAIEQDAAVLATAFSAEQKRLFGIVEPRTPVKEALWDGDPDHQAWMRAELERARQLSDWHDPEALAAEIRGMRPS